MAFSESSMETAASSPVTDLEPQTEATIKEMYAEQDRFHASKGRSADCLRAFPVLFVVLLIVFIYTVYITFHLIPLLQLELDPEHRQQASFTRGVSETIVFHFFFILFAITYTQSIITPPGTIPNTFEFTTTASSPSSNSGRTTLRALETKREGKRRYCKWCMKFKPDRTHHCRQCRRCVLKMDHHCPWIYNCVGWGNHKYFLLTLIYASLTTLFVFGSQIESVKSAIEEPQMRFGVFMLLLASEVFAGLFALISTCFFGFHLWLVVHNLSTIEFCEKHFRRISHPNIYDRGCPKNFQDVFGYNPCLWALPIDNRPGDGVHFLADEDNLLKRGLLSEDEPHQLSDEASSAETLRAR